jgi:hypothetical protein
MRKKQAGAVAKKNAENGRPSRAAVFASGHSMRPDEDNANPRSLNLSSRIPALLTCAEAQWGFRRYDHSEFR